jgi:hypothetical protein
MVHDRSRFEHRRARAGVHDEPAVSRTASEVAIIAAILSTPAIVLIRVAQRLRREAHGYQIELDGLTDPLA